MIPFAWAGVTRDKLMDTIWRFSTRFWKLTPVISGRLPAGTWEIKEVFDRKQWIYVSRNEHINHKMNLPPKTGVPSYHGEWSRGQQSRHRHLLTDSRDGPLGIRQLPDWEQPMENKNFWNFKLRLTKWTKVGRVESKTIQIDRNRISNDVNRPVLN